MSGRMKKHLTSDDLTILVRGKEIELKSSIKASLANIIDELLDFDSVSAKEIHGEWLENPRQRVAKYLKGARKREGLTQEEICDKLKIQQSNYSSMERGERAISSHLIPKLAKLLNVKAKRLDESEVESQAS